MIPKWDKAFVESSFVFVETVFLQNSEVFSSLHAAAHLGLLLLKSFFLIEMIIN